MSGATLAALLVMAAVLIVPVRSGRLYQVAAGGPQDPGTAPASSLRARLGRIARRLRHRDRDDVSEALLPVAEALGGAMRAGLAPGPAVALASAGVEGPLGEALRGVERRARMGEGLAAGWAEAAERLGNDEMRVLARAWSLSEETGTPLADAAATTARVLREGREQRDRTRTAVAGARTTMTILTALPAAGPLLAMLMGVDLHRLFLESPLVWGAFGAGAVLVAVGRWWVARLVTASLTGPELR